MYISVFFWIALAVYKVSCVEPFVNQVIPGLNKPQLRGFQLRAADTRNTLVSAESVQGFEGWSGVRIHGG